MEDTVINKKQIIAQAIEKLQEFHNDITEENHEEMNAVIILHNNSKGVGVQCCIGDVGSQAYLLNGFLKKHKDVELIFMLGMLKDI